MNDMLILWAMLLYDKPTLMLHVAWVVITFMLGGLFRHIIDRGRTT
jgi:hypothetical protein